jgi:hypothetical protein
LKDPQRDCQDRRSACGTNIWTLEQLRRLEVGLAGSLPGGLLQAFVYRIIKPEELGFGRISTAVSPHAGDRRQSAGSVHG